ncbi:MAG: hypothetical protein B6245_15030 [Desulfobacteraceae bacterium 4572_88]|nr:MAG: hypothetical protein B6245_15030 [Desulfobacteraceae bacterium 4572_88]
MDFQKINCTISARERNRRKDYQDFCLTASVKTFRFVGETEIMKIPKPLNQGSDEALIAMQTLSTLTSIIWAEHPQAGDVPTVAHPCFAGNQEVPGSRDRDKI